MSLFCCLECLHVDVAVVVGWLASDLASTSMIFTREAWRTWVICSITLLTSVQHSFLLFDIDSPTSRDIIGWMFLLISRILFQKQWWTMSMNTISWCLALIMRQMLRVTADSAVNVLIYWHKRCSLYFGCILWK